MILRPDNLGDVVLFSGALQHIRAYYPKAEIVLCVKRYVHNFLELCPHIDQLLCWEDLPQQHMDRLILEWIPAVRGRDRLRGHLWSIMRVVSKLKYRADVLLLPVRSPTGGATGMHDAAKAIQAHSRYGIAGDFCNQTPEDDQAADATYAARLKLDPDRAQEHELVLTRDFLRFLDMEATLDNLWPQCWTDDRDREWAEECVRTIDGTVTLAVCPGVTSLPGKFYPAAQYARIVSAIANVRFSVVLFGSDAEKGQCREVAAALAQCPNVASVNNLAGESTLRQLVEGLRRCNAVLAMETGALHIAVALCKPTVGILGGGHFGRFYPWGNKKIHRVAQLPIDCYWCNWKCRFPTIRCVQEIPPAVVARELKIVLPRISD